MTPRLKRPTAPAVASATLADQINAAHAACNQAARDALRHALAAGDLLSEAKAACRHGEWQAWLADNFAGSARTARAYLRLAAHRDLLEAKMADSAVLSIDGALRLLATPQSDRPVALSRSEKQQLRHCEAAIERGLSAAAELRRELQPLADAAACSIRDLLRDHVLGDLHEAERDAALAVLNGALAAVEDWPA